MLTKISMPSDRTGQDARALLDTLGRDVDAALERFLPAASETPESAHEAMRYSVLAPGKRFRPALLLIVADALEVPREASLPSACALELIHAFSLIHDDLPAMDDDDLRRGRPTNHVQFGEAVAILAGDALSALAFEIIARDTKDQALIPELVRILGEAVGTRGMIGGQVLDLLGEKQAPDLDLVREIHLRKTAALIRAACSMGAVLGSASEELNQALTRYGELVGLAFQITDDLLDETSTEAAMGKKTGKDQARGKQTYPACKGLDETRAAARALIGEALETLGRLPIRTDSLELLARFILSRAS